MSVRFWHVLVPSNSADHLEWRKQIASGAVIGQHGILSMERASDTRKFWLLCLILAAATVGAFWPLFHNQFIVYDDQSCGGSL